jgi:hypothetical protein
LKTCICIFQPSAYSHSCSSKSWRWRDSSLVAGLQSGTPGAIRWGTGSKRWLRSAPHTEHKLLAWRLFLIILNWVYSLLVTINRRARSSTARLRGTERRSYRRPSCRCSRAPTPARPSSQPPRTTTIDTRRVDDERGDHPGKLIVLSFNAGIWLHSRVLLILITWPRQ